MKLCLPIQIKPHGGGNYFFLNLLRYLDLHRIQHTDRLADRYDVLFANSWHVPAPAIWRAIRANPHVRIVHRVDGSAQDYGREPTGDVLQREANHLADLTIFQSQYCRHSTREKFPVIVHDGPVIHNPVDVEQFRPEGERAADLPGGPKVAAVTWSTNSRKGVASLYRVAGANPDIHFLLAGRFPDAPALLNIHLLGVLGRTELARLLRSCDVLVTFSENEACPNVVLEAMASGLPVLYKDSGAARELVGECGLPVEVGTFRAAYEQVMAKHSALSLQARERALTCFHPDVVFPRYLTEIRADLDRPTTVPENRRRRMAWHPARIVNWQLSRLAEGAKTLARAVLRRH